MRLIAWQVPGGGIVLEYPAYNDILRIPDDTDDDLINRCLTRTADRLESELGPGSVPHIIEEDQIPEHSRIEHLRWRDNKLAT